MKATNFNKKVFLLRFESETHDNHRLRQEQPYIIQVTLGEVVDYVASCEAVVNRIEQNHECKYKIKKSDVADDPKPWQIFYVDPPFRFRFVKAFAKRAEALEHKHREYINDWMRETSDIAQYIYREKDDIYQFLAVESAMSAGVSKSIEQIQADIELRAVEQKKEAVAHAGRVVFEWNKLVAEYNIYGNITERMRQIQAEVHHDWNPFLDNPRCRYNYPQCFKDMIDSFFDNK